MNADLSKDNPIYSRGIEIKGWLEQHKGISNYVIIDDMEYTLPEQQYHLILTDPNVGIIEWEIGTIRLSQKI